ncbi:MAG: hypothetical protein AUF74_00190 [Thaumarchaeota archaeon 13_1_20CM_2_38_5]|nr:MAG: hypothetical protein AUF74_00190 [Thaumarchaeota archaeon 13_1_20CM_2_38_5]
MILTSLLIGTQIFNPQLMVSADSIDLLTSKKVYFPGETIQIIGHFLPNAVLHIDLVNPLDNSKNSTQVQTDDTGRFQKNILIPYSAPNGTWKIVASSGNRLLSVDISIISSNPNKQNETIPLVTMCCGKPIYIGPPLPLKQFKSGTSATDVKCKQGFVLVIKKSDNSPACVKPQTSEKLIERGWGRISTDYYTKYANPDITAKFQSKIISSEKAVHTVQDYIKENNLALAVNSNSSKLKIAVSLKYVQLPPSGFTFLYDVDPKIGIPIQETSFNGTSYANPQWWVELEKYYLGLENKRTEDGYVVWDVDYRECTHCTGSYPMFMVDAITDKVVFARNG